MKEKILAEISALKPGTTLCPGELARRIGTTQAKIRPLLIELQQAHQLVIKQRGRETELARLRGPYRVARLEK